MTKRKSLGGAIQSLAKRWFIDAFSGMASGLFVTLIAGTIFALIAKWVGDNTVGRIINSVANTAKLLMGAGIGVGIAHALKAPKLAMFGGAAAGYIGAFADKIIAGTFAPTLAPGNPIGAYIVALIAVELAILVSGKTKIDIILVPMTILISASLGIFAAWPVIKFIDLISKGIEIATAATPFVMGVVIAVVMGLILTLPTSSAAIWVAIAANNPSDTMLLAGGAAVVGCAAHMVGFAIQSFRENKWGGLIAQGLGTSMLQIPNLMRHPQILIPPIIASAIVGPLATCVFKLRCNASGGGMGTSGLVGVFGTIEASAGIIPDWKLGLGIALLFFVIPAVVCFFVSEFMRRKGWIKFGDMKIDT
ncbi:MAG TPA: PTS sugar transporter subunit IIC [Clostridia bacterium]|nr:PTS sugar transporter subunit IIC [Clostridia bacterium]